MKLNISKKMSHLIDSNPPLLQALRLHFPKMELKIQNNRGSLLTMQKTYFSLKVSMHHLFLEADLEIIEALIEYFKKNGRAKTASLKINRFIEEKRDKIAKKEPLLKTLGTIYNLNEHLEFVQNDYFNPFLDVKITYFTTPLKKKRHITLGLYQDGLVKINQALDHPQCPDYFLQFIIYHEMLHHVFPTQIINSRRIMHSRAFRQKEKEFRHYTQAKKWQDEVLMQHFLKKAIK